MVRPGDNGESRRPKMLIHLLMPPSCKLFQNTLSEPATLPEAGFIMSQGSCLRFPPELASRSWESEGLRSPASREELDFPSHRRLPLCTPFRALGHELFWWRSWLQTLMAQRGLESKPLILQKREKKPREEK